MSPMFSGTPILAFSGFLLSIGFWMIHGLRKEAVEKRAATAAPESRPQSAE